MSVSLRERALRYLSRREYSSVELARKLSPHAQSPEEVESVLEHLRQKGLLSDARYVQMRINVRSSKYGNIRLVQELRQQGVADSLIEEELTLAEDELVRAREVWQRKFGGKEDIADMAERARQQRFLMSRGFSGETIRQVLRGKFEDD